MHKSQYTHLRNLFSLCCIALLMSSCSLGDLELDQGSQTPAAKEPTYFAKPTVYDEASSITVSFKAIAKYRPIIDNQNEFYLGAISAQSFRAIPYAEFHIYDASGTRIQQGETTLDGIVTAQIPKVLGDYTVKVFSRSFNSYVKVSVLKDLYSNIPHHIQKTFSLTAENTMGNSIDFTAPQSGNDLTAEADESLGDRELAGGAFNIHYMVFATNDYIRRAIGKNAGPSSNSNDWFVADKVQAYWRKGFNPGSYFAGPNAANSSFFIPSENKLFILGGNSGNVKDMDTDHFDNSVIIHEYAHFLDSRYSNPSSRGGYHDGNAVIDARLAWSEGFANYFQSEVLNGLNLIDQIQLPNGLSTNDVVTNYIDTNGYFDTNSPDGGSSLTFPLSITGHCGSCLDGVTADAGDFGNFREVSIARFLFKASRSPSTKVFTRGADYFGGGADFKYIWQIFAGENKSGNTSTNPFPYSLAAKNTYPVSHSGLGNYLLRKLLEESSLPTTNFDLLLDDEKQVASTVNYAQFLSAGSCSPVLIGPAQAENTANGYRSHQYANNDFYLFNHNGSGGTLALNYSVNTPAQPLNLDLILFKLAYDYIEDFEIANGSSNATIVRQSRSTNSSESISLNGLSKGYYIVAVKVNAYNKNSSELNSKTANYTLTHNGATLCGIER